MSQSTLKIISERVNRMVPRREIIVEIEHWGGGTPTRQQIVETVRNILNLPSSDVVVVRKILTSYGACVTRAYIHVYDSESRARAFEPKYILKRNGLVQEQQQQG
ncbi:30S ribosomal protein S24e [Infirmifilum lucidum]|uniref:Small ribosomal subunit protein eS24 n=1 Tax=Infirmifilum lucidum TaxID=2776706 RepID=A0A7L9FGM4_9CREN|nr:30S ribosomal protein S24e [Infirmifilum lucidum]QOJ78173.1 30S ribosomal protein S24e [Infirmifilum lucidum]